jgi:hypothetical protein
VRPSAHAAATVNVGRTETRFETLAARDGLHRGHRLPWLSNRGHLALEEIGAPSVLIDRLREIYTRLGGYEKALAAKRRGSDPTPDFLLNGHQIVEVDEVQHFTADRLTTLRLYPRDIELGFGISEYMARCETWRSTADRYRAAKPTQDFPYPGGRRAQRAYFDALRDLAAPFFGHGPVLRIPAPECDGDLAYRRFATRPHLTP